MSVPEINSALQTQGVNGITQPPSTALIEEDVAYGIRCPRNTYKTELSNASCTPCRAHSRSPSSSSSPDACACIDGFVDPGDGSCDRVCAPGFEARGGEDGEAACTGCRPSYYKPERGDEDCARCHPFSLSFAYNQTSVTSCLCEQGYIRNVSSMLCDPCPAGSFNNRVNDTECFSCSTECPA
jgi:hypothetical protein